MKVQDILTDESKWCQGTMVSDSGQMCLAGAIDAAYDTGADDVIKKVRDHTASCAVTWWNDQRDHTFAEVRALIEVLDI